MPLVIITPSSIGVSGSASLQPSAGVRIESGLPSGFSGPFSVETQTLTVNYVRVPTKIGIVSGTDSAVYSLSANAVRTMEVKETRLRAIITATYSKRKDYNSYATSAFQQTQKFSIVADADPFGETYGNVLSSVRYLAGPAGIVVTTQPYTRRVAWVEGTDVEVNKSVVGANYLVERESSIGTYIPESASVLFDDFNYAVNKDDPHTYLANGFGSYRITGDLIGGAGTAYPIFGKYGRQKETDFRFTSWLDNIGGAIKNSFLWRPTWILNTDYTLVNGTTAQLISSQLVGMSEYNPSVHQYD